MKVKVMAVLAAGAVALGVLAPHVADPDPPAVAGPSATFSPSTSVIKTPPSLRLRLSSSSVRAGDCVRATVLTSGPERAARITGLDSAPLVRMRDGRGGIDLCEGWTSGTPLRLRATVGRSRSAATRLRVLPRPWMQRLERVVGRLPVSVSVGGATGSLYGHGADVGRIPASNEKLLLTMALLDRFGPDARIATTAEARKPAQGVVRGNLWLVGHGDPEVGPSTIERLAARVRAAGIRWIRGSVIGDTSTFTRERWAPGWRRIALRFVSIPTALTFEGNAGPGGFVFDPERRAASALTADLRALGVRVDGGPDAGPVGRRSRTIASVPSAPLVDVLRRQNTGSVNLDAEVLGKRLGASVFGPPGTTAKGAAAIQRWTSRKGVPVVALDASGLSYRNRITTAAMVRLLTIARRTWGGTFLSTLAAPGEGTLAGRLGGLAVRAKTGTLLDGVSALSGYVRPAGSSHWLAFSIMSRGLWKDRAVAIEDAVVRIVAGA
jgi:D-alanyl-D-alanine carboxypeptidase/D-alanyl-D-alanine-endopeptidase (penicillin-binding protein 4)